MSAGIVTEILITVDQFLQSYVTEKVVDIATLVDPLVTDCLGIYILVLSYRFISGHIQEPFMSFFDRAVKVGAIGAIAVGSTYYNDLLVRTFQDSPVILGQTLISGSLQSGFNASTSATMGGLVDSQKFHEIKQSSRCCWGKSNGKAGKTWF